MYDRESPAKYSDDNHGQAWLKAKKNGVNVALSNVCFEYWLLLHLTETSQPANSCDDLTGTVAFKSAFREIGFSNYQKGEAQVADELITRDRIENAKRRARRINKQAQAGCPASDVELPYRLTPYTNVYEVLEAINGVAG